MGTDLIFCVKAQFLLEVLDQQVLQPLSNNTCRDQHQTVSRPLQLTKVKRVQSPNKASTASIASQQTSSVHRGQESAGSQCMR